MRPVFVTGSTGYLGRALIAALLDRGHPVFALVRRGAEGKVPAGAQPVAGDALDPSTFSFAIPADATLVHLIGTPHPTPAKAAAFRRVDLASIGAAVSASQRAGVRHLVYVSVAHPAPVMHAYIAARQEGEALVEASRIPATILRPWYVLGPGHYWPYLLLPVYAVLRWLPSTRASAERLGLVTRPAMTAALVRAIESPPDAGVRLVGVPEIRNSERLANKHKEMSMQEAQNTKVVQDAYAAFGRGDIQTLVTYLADDIVWTPVYGTGSHVPTSGVRRGKAAVAEFFKQVADNVQFSQFEPKEFVATGDKVVALGHYKATTPIKKGFDSDFAMVFTVRNGKVTHFQEFCDSAAINAAYALGAAV